MFKLGWGHRTKYSYVCKAGRGGTPHIPIEGIWSDIQSRVGRSRRGTPHIPVEGKNPVRGVGTPHIKYKYYRGGDTAHIMCTIMCGGGHRTYFVILQEGGTPHILCVQ